MLTDLTINYALSLLGTPYVWGGQSPGGVDCSGFVIMVLQADGRLPNKFDASSQGLFDYFAINGAANVKRPSVGNLVFYGKSQKAITHVAMALNARQVIEAAGGDSTTRNAEDSWKRGGHVRIRPIDYRTDIVAILNIDISNVLPLKAEDSKTKICKNFKIFDDKTDDDIL